MVQAVQTVAHTDFTREEIDEARRYPLVIRWSDEDEVYLVSLPDFGGVTLHADTVGKAAERGIELVAELIDIDRRNGDPVPAPGATREFVIRWNDSRSEPHSGMTLTRFG